MFHIGKWSDACLFLIILFSQYSSYSQKIPFVLGEYIVQAEPDMTEGRLFRLLYKMEQRVVNPVVKQLAKEPLNLFLVSTDYLRVNQIQFAQQLGETNGVIKFQRNRIIEERNTPNDINFPLQWQLRNTGQSGGVIGADINILDAWDVTTGGLTALGDTIVVCIIDDGLDFLHPDMKENIWINHLEIPDDGIDNDSNGYVDDYSGWNVLLQNDDITIDASHGTPVAGIVGAVGNNEVGVAGVNWKVKLMIVDYGATTEANALAAYSYPYNFRKRYNETQGAEGAFVVATNASWGIDFGKSEDAPLWCALYDSLGRVGILNACATANRNVNVDVDGDLPTSCESDYLISVTNVNKNNNKVSSAGFGRKSVDLGAYGSEAYTVRKGGDYGAFGGTSAATPHVAGTIGLMYSTPCTRLAEMSRQNPSLAALMVKDMILSSVTPNASLQGITVTGGVLNVAGAMQKSLTLCDSCTTVVVPVITEGFNLGELYIRFLSSSFEAGIDIEITPLEGFNDTIRLSGNTNDIFVVNLDGLCTEYQLRVVSHCGEDTFDFSDQYFRFFKTPGCCELPLSVSHQIVDGGVEIIFGIPAEQQSFVIEYLREGDQGEWSVIETEHSHAFIELNNCQNVWYRVKRKCNKFDTESDYTTSFLASSSCGFCTDESYCSGMGLDNSDEWIESFTFGPLSKTTGPQEGAYSLIMSQDLPVFKPGFSYPFSLVNGYNNIQFDEFYLIYLDTNQNGIFEESEELYVSPEATKEPAEGTLMIPIDAKEGITRLRVIISYNKPNGPCVNNDFIYGEIEDYCVMISLEEFDCKKPEVINLVENQTNTLTFEIPLSMSADSIKIEYRKEGSDSWNSLTKPTADFYTVPELDSCAVYEFLFFQICDSIISLPSEESIFKTSCSTNTKDVIAKADVRLYPNPFTDKIFLEWSDKGYEAFYLQIFNANGVVLAEYWLSKSNFYEGNLELIMPDKIPQGLYFVRMIKQSGESFIFKLVKL